jgi:hypothetical protein
VGLYTPKRAMGFGKSLTATDAINRLKDNDPSFTKCDLGNNAVRSAAPHVVWWPAHSAHDGVSVRRVQVIQMKASELLPQLGAALSSNSVCTELNLAGCNIDDHTIEGLTQALQVNSSLTSLSLEANKINNDGAIQIARALKANRSLLVLNLMSQKGTRFGDMTLGEFTVSHPPCTRRPWLGPP